MASRLYSLYTWCKQGIGSSSGCKAEFITVVTRLLYSDELLNMPSVSGEYWYSNNYDVAVNNGLFNENEFDFDKSVLNAPMPREEMALILVRACKQNDVYPSRLAEPSEISDINTVSKPYREAVIKAFSLGLITGKDDTGRFAPYDTLTRAEGATVLYRLMLKIEVMLNDIYNNQVETTDDNSVIVIYEGEIRNNRNAKEGDIFIKKDGTQVVLRKDQYGILGGGQSIAPDIGLNLGMKTVGKNGIEAFTYDAKSYGLMVDSTGKGLQNEGYYINNTTGEGHWTYELMELEKFIPRPDKDGAYEGEVSSDSYRLYVWKYGYWLNNTVMP